MTIGTPIIRQAENAEIASIDHMYNIFLVSFHWKYCLSVSSNISEVLIKYNTD